MSAEPLTSVELVHGEGVVLARQRAREVAELLGFDRQDQTRIATATSELARNAHRYAGGGQVMFLRDGDELRIDVIDDGPGIPHLDVVMSGTYESSTGMGRGLLSVQLLMDRFTIDAPPGRGTRVSAGKRIPSTVNDVTAWQIREALEPPDLALALRGGDPAEPGAPAGLQRAARPPGGDARAQPRARRHQPRRRRPLRRARRPRRDPARRRRPQVALPGRHEPRAPLPAELDRRAGRPADRGAGRARRGAAAPDRLHPPDGRGSARPRRRPARHRQDRGGPSRRRPPRALDPRAPRRPARPAAAADRPPPTSTCASTSSPDCPCSSPTRPSSSRSCATS